MKAFFQMSTNERAEFCQGAGIRYSVHGEGAIAPAQAASAARHDASPCVQSSQQGQWSTEESIDYFLAQGIPLTSDQRAYISGLVDEVAKKFDAYANDDNNGDMLMAVVKRYSVTEL